VLFPMCASLHAWFSAPMAAPFEIVRREDFSDVTYLLEVFHPQMARAAKPG